MKVWELVQELAQFEPDVEVEINIMLDKKECTGKIGEIPSTLETGDEVDVQVDLEEDADDYEVNSRTRYIGGIKREYCAIEAQLG